MRPASFCLVRASDRVVRSLQGRRPRVGRTPGLAAQHAVVAEVALSLVLLMARAFVRSFNQQNADNGLIRRR